MKSLTLVAAAVGMLQIASAQPHRRRAHQHQHVKKDGDFIYTVVDTVYAQATEIPEVIVYVDQNGNPVSTTTQMIGVVPSAWSTAHGESPSTSSSSSFTTSTSSSTSSTSSSATSTVAPVVPATTAPAESFAAEANVNVQVASTSSSVEAAPAYTPSPTTTAAEEEPAATTSSVSSSSTSKPENNGFGISYSPYNADGTCKTQSQVNTDFEKISGYTLVRTYGTDCKQVATVLSAAKAKGMKMFAGVFDLNSLSSEIATIVSAIKDNNGDWSIIDTISIGNELVNSGTASASAVVAAIGTARSLLKAAGYSGNVVTVDTLVAARANPSLCDASDYCAVNCHPFFDGTYTASQSGQFLTDMIPTLKSKLANQNQEVVITETGWPWQGETNQKAVPSLENQAAAISSIKTTFASNPSAVILFTAFNDMWKKNTADQFGAEQFWGMGGRYSS